MSNNKKNNAVCIICGKEYHLCIACERNKGNWKSWRTITDTENCYKIYKVLNDYSFNKISKNEAKALLENLDLKNLNSFKEKIKEKIKEIMKTKKQYSKNRKFKTDEMDIEIEVTTEETNDNVENVE